MAEQLQINVKVHLNKGDIKGQIERELKGLKDLNIDGAARINARLSSKSLAGIKKQLNSAIEGHSKKLTIHADVKGDKEINALTRNLRELRKLAAEPIKIHASVVGAGADKALEKAIGKSGKGGGNVEVRTRVQGVASAERQLNSLRRNARDLYQEMERIKVSRNKISPSDMNDDLARHYKNQMEQVSKSIDATQAKMVKLYQNSGMSKKQAAAHVNAEMQDIMKNDGKVVKVRIDADEQGLKTAVKDAESSLKKLVSLEKELARAQRGARNMGLSSAERGAYQARSKFLSQQIAQQHELAKANRQFNEQAYLTAKKDIGFSRDIAIAKDARQNTARYSGGSRSTRGFGDSYNVWSALQSAGYAIAGIISNMNEVDRAVTKVTKVVPDSQRAVEKWTRGIYKDASSVGKSVPEYANAVEQWATAGYNLKQSNALAKRSVMGSFVGDVDVNDMVNYMAVPLNSFKRQHLKADDIINSMNEVSNKHAVEMTDLGQAYSKASAVVSATGTTFGQLTGMITGAQEATRAGGDVIGRSIKAISQNFAKMSSGVTATDKKRAEFFHGLGVDLKDSNGKMKSTYEVMDDLSKVWGKLSKQQKQDAALYAAGKEHSAQFTGMLNNWDTVKKATSEAEGQTGLGKEGSAYQEMEKQKKSIQFQLAALGNNWRQFLANLTGGREGIADMLGMANQFLNIGQKLTSSQGLMSTARWAAMTGGILMARRALNGLLRNFNDYLGIGQRREDFARDFDALGVTGTGSRGKVNRRVFARKRLNDEMNKLRGQFGLAPREYIPRKENDVYDPRHSSGENEPQLSGGGYVGGGARATKSAANAEHELESAGKKARTSQKGLGDAMKGVGEHAIMAGGSMKNAARGIGEASTNAAKGASRIGRVVSTAKTAGRVVLAGIDTAAQFAGAIGLIFDAVTVTGMVLNAFGIHPVKEFTKALHPARTAANALNKSLDATASSIDKTSQSIENNGLVNGSLKQGIDGAKQLSDSLSGLNPASKLDKGALKDIKDTYNSIAKKNGLELRITGEQEVGNVLKKVKDLQEVLQNVKKDDASKLASDAFKQNQNVVKALSGKNMDKLLKSNSVYNKKLDALRDSYSVTGRHTGRNFGKGASSLRKDEDALRQSFMVGPNNAALWNSKEGRKLSDMVAKAQKSTRQAIGAFGENYANGMLTKGEVSNMSVEEQKLAGLGVIKNLRDLISSGADKKGSDVATAKKNLNDVLTASGVGKKNIEKIQNAALNGSNSSMMRALMSGGFGAGNIGAMAGITAQYQQQHGFGNKAIKAAIRDESQVEKYRGKHKSAANAEALYDPNTGFLDYSKIARFNSGAVTTKRGRSLFKSMGGKYQTDGTMSIGQALDLTKGMDGDPTKILSNIAKGKAAANTIASVANNARGGKATGAQVASAIAQSQAVSGTKMNYTQFDAALRQSNLTGEQKDAALADRKRNFTQSGNAKTLKGFAEATKGLSSLSKSEFKDLGKALSSTERKAALKDAQDKGLLTAKQAKALEKWSNGNSNGKTESSTMPGKGSDGKLNKLEKAAIKSAVGSLKGEKGKVSKNDFNKKMKSNGLKGNKDAQRKAYNDLLKAGKLSKSAQKSLAKQLGLKVPKTATKNNNSGKSRNSGNGKSTKATKTNKTTDSSKKKGTARAGQIKANSQLGKMLAKALGLDKKSSSKPKSGSSSSTKKKSSSNNKKAEKEGRDEEKARQRGRDSVKRQASAKKASESKKAVKDAQNQGKKEAQAKSKGSSSGSKGAKKSQKKVKVKADLDTKSMNSKLKSAGKKQKIKVKADVDAKNVKGKLQKAGKGAKVKVKADVDAKNIKGKLQKAGKGTKVKVKTDADTAGLKNKIKSAAKGQKAKVKVDADTSGVKGKIKAAVSGIKATVKVNVSANTGKLNALKSALAGISSKRVSVSASVKGIGKVNSLKSAINGVHSKHVTVAAKTKGLGEVKALQAAIDSVHGKSVTVSVTKSITTVTHTKKGKSVGIGSIPAGVSADVGVGAGPTQITGMGMPGSVTNYSTGGDDQTVNEDYWRYMDKQLYTGLPLDEQVNKLENAVTQADEDMDKLISVAKQRIDVDNKQIAYQKQMQAAYQQEVTDMINKLHGFGFQSNGNRITNLGHAKDIKGDNASKVDEYLGKYQTAYQNLSEATKTIQDLQTDIWQQGKNQEDYRNTKDQKMVEKLQRSLEILNTVVENHKSIMDRYAESLTEQDYVMKNKNSADQIMTKYNDVYDLMQKFNELSRANFVGTKEADNAQNLYESLQSIRDSVMENLDAIEELKKSMRDNEIAAVADNLARYTDNLNDSIDRLKNNVSNLEDGLLSGTNYTDLISSNFGVASFDQRSAYEKNVEDRIALEKQFDAALDAFAKKNVDRTAQVANQQLQINFQMYEELAKMGEDFANKTLTNIEPIRAQYEPKGMASDMDIPGITRNKEYQKTSEEYQKRMNALKDEYVDKLSRANTASEKEAINQEMVYKQLELQETVLKGQIDADQKAIATLKQMANDPSMNSEQLKNIKDQIREYTQNAIDAQNQIKDAIKERFEYEKQLIDKTMDEYQRMSDTVSNLVTIADALNLDGVTQGRLIGRQIEADMNRYELYLNKIAQLRQQMSQYEKGSFEYNQLSEMVNGYQSDLETLITTLLDETRSQFKKTLDENMKEVQRNTYGGKTMDQAKFDQELWYSPSQKELRIEEMRLKITELEDKTIDKKISALDRQERLSKSEADYVDKQLDLALAQQKLNNALHKRDVQYITKTADGRFQNGYTYDQAQVDDARKEVNTDKQQLEDLKQTETNDFNTKFKEIIDAMTDGSINQEEARREIQDLAKSKEFVLGDIKGFDPSLLEKPIEAYNKFVETNKDILNRASGNSTIAGNNNYQEIIKGFGDQFKAVSKDLGEIFGKELKTILYRPDGSGFIGGGTTNSLTIQNMSVSLPNVRDIDEFREALNTLPQVAAQKATSK